VGIPADDRGDCAGRDTVISIVECKACGYWFNWCDCIVNQPLSLEGIKLLERIKSVKRMLSLVNAKMDCDPDFPEYKKLREKASEYEGILVRLEGLGVSGV
jgi:hypothetical protein